MVYVLSHTGRALMPTERHGKVRHLLREGRAVVVMLEPFTIRLLYDTAEYVQDVTLGVDAGSRTVGLSATTETKELYSSEVTLRNDIVNLISTRRESRRTRRSRKLRYRECRFINRRRPDGWFAPSIEAKLQEHLSAVKTVTDILPVRKIVVEVAQFDTQLLKNPDIQGEQYQHGDQMGFWNVREYVLFRDGHACQHCHGRSKDPVLNVHHIESRKTGGDSPDNLITLCETCHKAYHRGEIELKVKRSGRSLRDAAFMGVIRWRVYEVLKRRYPELEVRTTYGYKTKHNRIANAIEKTHCADAFCIAGHLGAKRLNTFRQGRCIARHTRSIHVQTMKTGGVRRRAIAPHCIGNTRLQRYDKVLWNGLKCFIAGSTGGRPVLRDINWELVTPTASVNAKVLKFLSRQKGGILYQLVNKQ